METKVESAWSRAPRQARSHATLERFVQATRELLDERSFEEITVADIVSRAERTVGSFYARFDDKYAVLLELVTRTYDRIDDVVHAFCDPVRWEDATLADFVAESVRLNVQAYRQAGPLFRAALTAAMTDGRFRDSRIATMQLAAEAQKGFVMTRLDEVSCGDPARASDQVFELVSATLDHELLFGRFTTTGPTSDGELIDDLTSRSLQVLGVRPNG